MAKKTFKAGDTVKVYGRRYINGTRRPGLPNGRFSYHFLANGTLLAKNDPRGYTGLMYKGWTQQDIDSHLSSHLGLANASGSAGEDGLTEGNNPVLMPNGEVLWVYREQIRSI